MTYGDTWWNELSFPCEERSKRLQWHKDLLADNQTAGNVSVPFGSSLDESFEACVHRSLSISFLAILQCFQMSVVNWNHAMLFVMTWKYPKHMTQNVLTNLFGLSFFLPLPQTNLCYTLFHSPIFTWCSSYVGKQLFISVFSSQLHMTMQGNVYWLYFNISLSLEGAFPALTPGLCLLSI